jgi:uncharacterized Zn finger protein
MKKELFVKSSDGLRDYLVEFLLEDGRLYIFCSCESGKRGNWCKHRESLILNSMSGLSAGLDVDDLNELRNWISKSEFPRLLARIELAKDELDNAKKALSMAAKKGVTA